MLLGVLDLEQATVADVMVPKHKIIGLDLNQPWQVIVEQMCHSPYSRLPVYREDFNNILGILHLRKLSFLIEKDKLSTRDIERLIEPAYFVPGTATLQRQLAQFQKSAEHLALVVDEYGDIQGLATVADILEEIVGEFISDQPASHHDIHKQADGAFEVSASIPVRELNRKLHLELPTSAKTLGGLITEHLQDIPLPGISIMINHYPIEILGVEGNAVVKAKIFPRLLPETEDGREH
jgi:Mg2+/Co2+ transporter CorB